MKNRAATETQTDNQSYDLCMTMTASCDIEDSGFCSNGLVVTAKPGDSGASTGGGQQNPRPVPAAQQPAGGKLRPPPVQ
ncbi:hypothetical protein D3C72_2249640 [compost metagenome]